jgi:hypothetical protein
MARSPTTALLVVGCVAGVAGALSRIATYLPKLLVEGGTPLSTVGVVLPFVSVVQVLVSPVGAAVVGWAVADALDLEDDLPLTVLAVYVAALAGLVVGAVVALSLSPPDVHGAGSLLVRALNGLVVGLTGAVTVTVAVVAGVAVRRLRSSSRDSSRNSGSAG